MQHGVIRVSVTCTELAADCNSDVTSTTSSSASDADSDYSMLHDSSPESS